MEFVVGVIVAAVAVGIVTRLLVPEPADRSELFRLLFRRFIPAPAPPPAPEPEPKVEPVPPPPVAPALKFGNILRVESELEDPDLSQCFVFPEKVEPTLAYDDFNRRLVVFTIRAGQDGPTPLFPTHINDEPIRLSGSENYLSNLIQKQFRPAYPVLVDYAGLFAAHSAAIEKTPLHRPPIVRAVLNIPEHERPVIFSVLAADQSPRKGAFIFRRYGFVDFMLDPAFLGQDWSQSLPKTFEHFLGPADQWMYFSRARLRHALMLLDQRSAQMARELSEAVEAKRIEDARSEEERENDVRFDSFAHLFKLEQSKPQERLQ